jgi:putative oxidoreductase
MPRSLSGPASLYQTFSPIEKQMGVPYPMIWAYLAIFAESAAAICLAVGLFTRLAALIVWIEMGIIIVFFQWQFGYFRTAKADSGQSGA